MQSPTTGLTYMICAYENEEGKESRLANKRGIGRNDLNMNLSGKIANDKSKKKVKIKNYFKLCEQKGVNLKF